MISSRQSKGRARRSWVDIFMDILEASLTPQNKNRVMYKSNLNFEQFNKYSSDLLRKGFIEKRSDADGRTVYKTTEPGRALLEAFLKTQEIVSSEVERTR